MGPIGFAISIASNCRCSTRADNPLRPHVVRGRQRRGIRMAPGALYDDPALRTAGSVDSTGPAAEETSRPQTPGGRIVAGLYRQTRSHAGLSGLLGEGIPNRLRAHRVAMQMSDRSPQGTRAALETPRHRGPSGRQLPLPQLQTMANLLAQRHNALKSAQTPSGHPGRSILDETRPETV